RAGDFESRSAAAAGTAPNSADACCRTEFPDDVGYTLPSFPVDVVHRNPCVAMAFGSNVPDAGKGQGSGGHQAALRCKSRKLTVSLRGRRVRVDIIDDRDPRLWELHRGDVNDVAHQLQLLTLAFDQVEAVPGRMARCGYRGDAGQYLRAPRECLYFAGAQ